MMTLLNSGKMAGTVSYQIAVPVTDTNALAEVEKAGFVRCDFSKFMDHELRPHPSYPMASNLDIGPLKYYIKITGTRMEVEVLLNKTLVGRCDMKVDVDQPRRYSGSSWDEGDD